jgi:hypothetical protein
MIVEEHYPHREGRRICASKELALHAFVESSGDGMFVIDACQGIPDTGMEIINSPLDNRFRSHST